MAGENTVDFKWLFVQTIDDYECTMDSENVNNSVINKEFKLFFKPMGRVYLYLLLRDPANDFVMIFPESFKTFSKKSYSETEYYIPEDGNWIKFNKQPGKHKLYFLVTKNRMTALENLINNYQESCKNENQTGVDHYKKMIIAQLQQAERNFIFNNNKKDPESVMGGFRDDAQKDKKSEFEWVNMTDNYLNDGIGVNFNDIYLYIYTLIYE